MFLELWRMSSSIQMPSHYHGKVGVWERRKSPSTRLCWFRSASRIEDHPARTLSKSCRARPNLPKPKQSPAAVGQGHPRTVYVMIAKFSSENLTLPKDTDFKGTDYRAPTRYLWATRNTSGGLNTEHPLLYAMKWNGPSRKCYRRAL